MSIVDKGIPRLLTRTADGDPVTLVAGAMQLVGYLTWDALPEPGADSRQATIWPEQLEYEDIPLFTPARRSNFVNEEATARQIAFLSVENDILREAMRATETEIRDWISKPDLDRDVLLSRLSLVLLKLDEARRDHAKAHLFVRPLVEAVEPSGEKTC